LWASRAGCSKMGYRRVHEIVSFQWLKILSHGIIIWQSPPAHQVYHEEHATMITTTDLDRIDTSYFQIIEVKEYTLVLRSRNTGHYWSLLERIANGCRTFVISHKHHDRDPYHFQVIRGSADGGIGAAVEYIMHHDEEHLCRLREKEIRRERGRERRLEARGELPHCGKNLPHSGKLPHCRELPHCGKNLPHCGELPHCVELPHCGELPEQV